MSEGELTLHRPAAAKPLQLLIADDDAVDLELCLRQLKRSDVSFSAEVVSTRAEFVSKLQKEKGEIDIVLTDYRMKNWSGLDALSEVQRICPDIPVILLSGTLGDELAVECIKLGVTDYVLKDQLARLPAALRHAQDQRALREAERRALAALRESEEHYRSMVENATYGICRVSLDGVLQEVNPALVHMLGYDSAAELLALKTTQPLYRESDTREHLYKELMSTGRCDSTVEWLRKDGKVISVRLNGRLARNGHGALAGAMCAEGVIEDVTERLALEKQLFQAQKFEAIGQLAGGVAHDFNNMIGAIVGWADLGLEECGPTSPLRRYFEKVRLQADRAAALTRQLLAFARRQIFEPRTIDLNQTAVETLSLLEKVIGSNIEMRATLASDLAVIRADPVQVEQVLMNLCINARDAMPQGGSLTIESSNVTLDQAFCALEPLAQPGPYVMLRVSDIGTGMDAATLDRIFEPFFTTKEMGKGTGLGLATVYGIVRQHGGFIQVDSMPGAGTTFRVYFRASENVAPAIESAQDLPAVQGGSETIFIAEDHEGLRQLAAETLGNMGYRTIVAGDGEEALEKFRAHRHEIDLLVLDVMLPKIAGPDLYARIQRDRADLPVVFATGYSPDLALLQSVVERGLPVLQKPYAPRDLARRVREALDQHMRVLSERP